VQKAGKWFLGDEHERFRIVHTLDQEGREKKIRFSWPGLGWRESIDVDLARRARSRVGIDRVGLDVVALLRKIPSILLSRR
jgi:hypothetical protein